MGRDGVVTLELVGLEQKEVAYVALEK